MKYGVFFIFFIAASAYAKPPERVLICHIGSEEIDGEIVEQYQSKLLPEKAAAKHIENHGDFLIEADEEGNLTPCDTLSDGINEKEVAALLRSAGTNNDDLKTPADTIHPNIHQNNGPGNAACPGDQDHCQNMHGIGNNPGQSGADPADGKPGFADQLQTVHGGIGEYNKNAN